MEHVSRFYKPYLRYVPPIQSGQTLYIYTILPEGVEACNENTFKNMVGQMPFGNLHLVSAHNGLMDSTYFSHMTGFLSFNDMRKKIELMATKDFSSVLNKGELMYVTNRI